MRTITSLMQLNFKARTDDVLTGRMLSMPVEYRKRPNARRYILRLNRDGNGGCVTIPRGGCLEEARKFARRNVSWLEERLQRSQANAKAAGDENKILFHGEEIPLVAVSETDVSFAGHTIQIGPGTNNTRTRIKLMLWELAQSELPNRLSELAAQHGLIVRRVAVRDQRSRWGSCSARGVVSLNWRLIQAPEFVRDYVIVHELMHLREMNHSARFWKLVQAAFPKTQEAEQWLKRHAPLLRQFGRG